MSILLGFSPFILFAIMMRFSTPSVALFAAAAVALVLIAREWRGGKSIKVLEAGTVILFGSLGLFVSFAPGDWSILGVRLAVDIGLFAIVVVSIAVRRPFTLQYAREQVSAEIAALPMFYSVNAVITWGWAAAFAVMVIADAIMLYLPAVPLWVGVALTVVALFAAFRFTRWYPEHVRAPFAATAPGGATTVS